MTKYFGDALFERLIKIKATIHIQKHIRKRLAKKLFEKLKKENQILKNAIKIQSFWKGVQARRVKEGLMKKRNICAKRIQRAMRQFVIKLKEKQKRDDTTVGKFKQVQQNKTLEKYLRGLKQWRKIKKFCKRMEEVKIIKERLDMREVFMILKEKKIQAELKDIKARRIQVKLNQ